MSKNDIMELLKNGASIEVKSYMNFKRNKLIRGGKSVTYSINGNTIKSTQFDAISDLLEKDAEVSTSFCTVYKSKVM